MYPLCAFFAFVVFYDSNVLDVIVRGDPAGRHEICGKIGGVASPGPGPGALRGGKRLGVSPAEGGTAQQRAP
jgi:hypothetical protein